ncbi:adhesion G protein-coupled receptor E2 isoform X3 [Syngnathoides biaculeatus]|uniref:adhesion G protein-coupled receptor E2 isoform X3 n=1 Tax=Syngnathoides biaculeatus TaxID=300417 RepID=UPI002ADDAB64|nr:adhesion G protein-coupled receptor E2 isoform X3 [Syngnathoides biaculeatus]
MNERMTAISRLFPLSALYLSSISALSESSCSKGFMYMEGKCIDEDECKNYPSDNGPCGVNAKCLNTIGSFHCQCDVGFHTDIKSITFTAESSLTCTDINECLENNGICGRLQNCINTIPMYDCACYEGFVANVNAGCDDVDECLKENICGPSAKCINTAGSYDCVCDDGFATKSGSGNFTESRGACEDVDDCLKENICGPNAKCINTAGSFYCVCDDGFATKTGRGNFTESRGACEDVDDCLKENNCGPNAKCINTAGSYYCVCDDGFATKSGRGNFTLLQEPCEAVCSPDERNHCGNGSCRIGASGPRCACHAGFTNYGDKAARCTSRNTSSCIRFKLNTSIETLRVKSETHFSTALHCDAFEDAEDPKADVAGIRDLMMLLRKSCEDSEAPDVQHLLSRILALIDDLFSAAAFDDNRKVSIFLDTVESALRMTGPFIQPLRINKSSAYAELDLHSHKGPVSPEEVATLSTKPVTLNIKLETVAGDRSQYPGFANVFLLSYANLENFTDGFYGGVNPEANRSYVIISKAATVSVTNDNTSRLGEPVELTFRHLTQVKASRRECVFWDASRGDGSWSADGCTAVESNSSFTVCSCNHLSTFAVLMALYDVEATLELQVVTWAGLTLSLICLLLCILTFSLIRSIQSPRTTIHLHLCVSLFVGILIFLVGISRTENQSACAAIAGLLHFFFLAAFCWMCLEGVQLFRMVILVFNTNFPTRYMMAGGYGVPAAIVAVCAGVYPEGYGTEKFCWLKLKFIWIFWGPACGIIVINIFFFFITAWKLAQKFSSLNPDMNKLQKIKAFIATAVAQVCVLGTTWLFGCFQFEKSTMAMSYLFTLFASLQGLMLFVMHCLFSKQVRDEYGNFLSRFRAPQKKNYSEFSSVSSRQHASASSRDTGESHF